MYFIHYLFRVCTYKEPSASNNTVATYFQGIYSELQVDSMLYNEIESIEIDCNFNQCEIIIINVFVNKVQDEPKQ